MQLALELSDQLLKAIDAATDTPPAGGASSAGNP